MINKSLCRKILSVGPRYKTPYGGIAQVMYNYSKLVFEDYRVVVNSGGSESYRKIYYLISGSIKFIFLLLFDRNIRIVHIHTASNTSFLRSSIYVSISKFFKKRIIMHIHSGEFIDYYKHNSSFVRKTLLKCDKIIVLTQMWNDMLVEISGLTNTIVLQNIIPKPVIKPLKYDDGLTHFLFMARITREKGIFDLINCINKYKTQLRGKAIFHVAGRGLHDELLLDIKEKGIEDIVKYEGWVLGEDKNNLINKCDVFILPTHFEALSLSILEAMSFNKPIVASRVGGIPSIVKHGENGLLFKSCDLEDMINCIMYFIENPTFISKMGNASEKIVSEYYAEEITPKLQNIYESLL